MIFLELEIVKMMINRRIWQLCVCINFIHEGRGLQFKVDFERQIFEKFFDVFHYGNGKLHTSLMIQQIFHMNVRIDALSQFIIRSLCLFLIIHNLNVAMSLHCTHQLLC